MSINKVEVSFLENEISTLIKSTLNQTKLAPVYQKGDAACSAIELFYICAGMELGIAIASGQIKMFKPSSLIVAIQNVFKELDIISFYDINKIADIYRDTIEYSYK